MPEISVIIPAYNQGDYLREAIQSVIEQTYRDLEIIVVDDGSTDHTADVAQGMDDARVVYVYQQNQGLSAARNTGIRHAQGKYLSFLDSDDRFFPHKLEVLIQALKEDPRLGMVAGQAVLINEHGEKLPQTFDSQLPAVPAELVLGNPLHVGSVLLSREWQQRVGFFDETLRSYEDWDLWLRLVRAGCPMRTLASPVSMYRFHTAQMTRNGSQMTRASFAVLEKVFTDPALPAAWQQLRGQAYANAHIRAAAHAYLTQDFSSGKDHLEQAVAQNPDLLSNGASRLAQRLAGLTQLPKTNDPLAFLETVYAHLPPALDLLAQHAAQHLGQAAIELAFRAYQAGNLPQAGKAARQAVRYQPRFLLNRGLLAILMRSWLHTASSPAPRAL